jgi:hypothetical protein
LKSILLILLFVSHSLFLKADIYAGFGSGYSFDTPSTPVLDGYTGKIQLETISENKNIGFTLSYEFQKLSANYDLLGNIELDRQIIAASFKFYNTKTGRAYLGLSAGIIPESKILILYGVNLGIDVLKTDELKLFVQSNLQVLNSSYLIIGINAGISVKLSE